MTTFFYIESLHNKIERKERKTMSKTKIVIVQLKELIYTGIFVGLGILLILLLVFMFLPKGNHTTTGANTAKYKPGVYTTQLSLNDTQLNMEVVLDENHINSVSLVNLDETVSTMYPLLEPALEEISSQLSNNVALSDVTLSENSKYTQTLLLGAIETALEKASVTK